MSSIYIVIAIVALLTALVCYIFIAQHLAKKRKQQQRILHALRQRQQLFRFMVSGFPPGFLPTELNTLVYRTLINTCEQLAKLEPEGNHDQERELYSKQLATAEPAKRTRLEGEQQINEARSGLKELLQFITLRVERGQIQKPQAAKYIGQIRHLLLQVTIDSSMQQAKQARQNGKLKLAIHHYTLARQQLLKEPTQQNMQTQVEQISALIEKLEAEVANSETQTSPTETSAQAWDSIEEEESWKKKQIYD